MFGEKSVRRRSVLEGLARGARTVSELAAALGEPANGHLSATLEELRLAGFAAKDAGLNPQTGGPVREARWRLRDNYARFYLHYVRPRKAAVEAGLFPFGALERLDGWETILGLQFENLVLDRVSALLPKIGLRDSLVFSAAPYRQEKTKRAKGCQIDLLVQAKRSVCVVEIKRRREIGRGIVDEVAEKVSRLRLAGGLSVRTALVYAGELSPAVREEGFFDFIVGADELFADA